MKNEHGNYNYKRLFENFFANMKEARIKKKITQKELADLVGVSYRTIQNYEAGTTMPHPAAIENIAVALGVSVDELIMDNEDGKERMRAARQIEKMETDPLYGQIVQEEMLLEKIFNKAKFLKQVRENFITEKEIDEILGGKLNKTREEKIFLIKSEMENEVAERMLALEEAHIKHIGNSALEFNSGLIKIREEVNREKFDKYDEER